MELSLAEQLLLLSYDEVTGKPAIPSTNLEYGLSGAHLLDLTYAGKLAIEGGRMIAVDHTNADPAVVKIRAQKPHSADYWVYHLASSEHRQQLLDYLVAVGVLVRREHRVLGVFPVRAYPEADPAQERALVDHLRAVTAGEAPPDHRSVSLLALAQACDLDRHLFPGLDQKVIRRRITELSRGEWSGPAVQKIINAMNAAVLAAVSGGVVASTAGGLAAT